MNAYRSFLCVFCNIYRSIVEWRKRHSRAARIWTGAFRHANLEYIANVSPAWSFGFSPKSPFLGFTECAWVYAYVCVCVCVCLRFAKWKRKGGNRLKPNPPFGGLLKHIKSICLQNFLVDTVADEEDTWETPTLRCVDAKCTLGVAKLFVPSCNWKRGTCVWCTSQRGEGRKKNKHGYSNLEETSRLLWLYSSLSSVHTSFFLMCVISLSYTTNLFYCDLFFILRSINFNLLKCY